MTIADQFARTRWKRIWRLLRICRRESLKASRDAMLFGTGVVLIDSSGEARHIPISEVIYKEAA